MKRRGDSLWLWAAYALLLLSCLKDVANPDIFWHLSAGQRILQTHAVPRADWLSFTRAGAPWTDFEWLQQAIWQALYAAAGWWGLIALKTALLAGSAAVLERTLARAGAGPRARACAVAVAAACWATVNDVRADNVTLLLFCAVLAALESAARPRAQGEPARRSAPAWAWAAAGLVFGALWADLHGGFVLGLAAAAAYALFDGRGARTRGAALLLGGLAGTLLTPYGAGLYGVFLAHARAESTMSRLILEWQWSSPKILTVWPFWLLGGYAAWAFSALRPRRAALAPWLVLAALFALGAAHQRNSPYFVAAAALLPALALARAGRLSPPRLAAPLCVLACGALLAVMPNDVSRSGLRERKFPEGAAAYLQAHPEVAKLKLYNPWGWGGYLAWRLAPPYRVFFDGRYIFHDLLADSMAATSDPRAWNRFLDEQKLDGALLMRDQPDMRVRLERWDGSVVERTFPYEVLFMPPQRWRLLYEDEVSALYVRR